MNINNLPALDMYDSGWTRSSGGGMRQQLVYRSQANILRNARQFGSKSRTPIFAQFVGFCMSVVSYTIISHLGGSAKRSS